MKILSKFLIILLINLTTQLLIKTKDPNENKKERKLTVFPSYNEINEMDEYVSNLKGVLSKIKKMRSDLVDIENNSKHSVDYIVSKIDNKLQDDAYDNLLNQIFFKKLNKIKGN